MTAFAASFRNEWSKLLRRKKYIVFLIIGVFLCLLWTALGQLFSAFLMRQGGFSLTLTPTPMGTLPFSLQILIPFLMFMGVTDLLTVECADNTMKAMLCRPVNRWKLYASKILAVMAYCAIYLAVVFVVSTVLNQIFGRPETAANLLISLASYALTLIPLAVLAAFAAFVAILGRSGTLTMFILIILYLLLSFLPIVFPVLNEMIFTSYLSWYRLWVGALPGAFKLVHMLLIVFSYGIVFFTAGSLIFDKKGY